MLHYYMLPCWHDSVQVPPSFSSTAPQYHQSVTADDQHSLWPSPQAAQMQTAANLSLYPHTLPALLVLTGCCPARAQRMLLNPLLNLLVGPSQQPAAPFHRGEQQAPPTPWGKKGGRQQTKCQSMVRRYTTTSKQMTLTMSHDTTVLSHVCWHGRGHLPGGMPTAVKFYIRETFNTRVTL